MTASRFGTILKILMVPLMPMVFVFTMGNACGQSSASGNPNSMFTFEYDHMIGNDVFLVGSQYAKSVYLTCDTDLDIITDETNIPATSIAWNLLIDSMTNHAQTWTPGGNDFKYPAYVMGIPSATSVPGGGVIVLVAKTYHVTDPSTGVIENRFTAIFVQTIQNLIQQFPHINTQKMLEKTVIHELGHSRGIFDHLCLSGTTQNPAHNDPACVMGIGFIGWCTLVDIYLNPKFCPADIAFLKKVTW